MTANKWHKYIDSNRKSDGIMVTVMIVIVTAIITVTELLIVVVTAIA